MLSFLKNKLEIQKQNALINHSAHVERQKTWEIIRYLRIMSYIYKLGDYAKAKDVVHVYCNVECNALYYNEHFPTTLKSLSRIVLILYANRNAH